jgi:flagellar motility protein MotE (MotC chaperone)
MNFRLFATAAIFLAGAAGLQAIETGGGLFALLAAPADAAEPEEPVQEAPAGQMAGGEPAGEAAAPLPTPEGDAAAAPSFSEKIGASAEEYRILISLQERRQELEAWEAEIDTRAQLVDSAEARVEERLAELHSVRAQIEDLLGQLDAQEQGRIDSLVSTYEKMKAADAARILAGLDDRMALLVVSRMKEANLAAVLGDMTTEDARRITGMLAARADTSAIVGDAPRDAAEETPEGPVAEAPVGDPAAGET